MIVAAFATTAQAADDALMHELVPTGKLRIAIAVGPAPSALYSIQDASGNRRGVTIDLGNALAKKLTVAVEFVPYLASGEIQASADKGVWDVSFMPVDEERKKFVDFGNAYHLLQSTYLVAPGASIKSVAEANAAGVRIVGGFLNSTTAIAVPKNKPAALAYAGAFIEEAKASGLVRRAFDEMGLKTAQVAPAGMKP
jgi:polar amino acid transport system substrate-binding protein